MASRADLELAKRLLASAVVGENAIRDALEVQADLLQRGKVVSLARVLIAKGHLARDASEAIAAGDPLSTQPFSSYRLHRLVGEGGSSAVYEATYLANGARVAVKVLNAVQGLRHDLVVRFEDEASLLIRLEHENIVAGYEVGFTGGLHWFSMDFIEGPTVLQMIDRAGALEGPLAIWITVQVAKALAYLHRNALLHRDIKPGNVMIDASGRARLIDLGLVRRLDARKEGDAAEEETTVGTVEYIAPEQARGRGDIDVRADIYSLGVSLYHMAIGDVPYHGDSNYEVMAKHILTGLETQKVKNRRVPPEVHFAIVKMMSKEREYRYRDMDDVVTDLSRFLPDGGPPRIVLPVAPASPPGPLSSKGLSSGALRSPVVPPRKPHGASGLRRRPRP